MEEHLMKNTKKILSCIMIFSLFLCLFTNSVYAGNSISNISDTIYAAQEITPRTPTDRCVCGEWMIFYCLRNQSVLAETGTHGNCTRKMWKSPSMYKCSSCGYKIYTNAYHYCFMIHSSCGAGTEWWCPCEAVYIPDYAR